MLIRPHVIGGHPCVVGKANAKKKRGWQAPPRDCGMQKRAHKPCGRHITSPGVLTLRCPDTSQVAQKGAHDMQAAELTGHLGRSAQY